MSKRKYIVVGFDNSKPFTQEITFEELVNTKDTFEFIYDLWEEDIDKILDLKVGQSRCVKTTRDGSEDLGVINRIS
jgi:hypothetical protein